MILLTIDGEPQPFRLELASFADGSATCVDVATPPNRAGISAWHLRIADNIYPDSRRLVPDHFFLRPDLDSPIVAAMLEHGIIEPVPGGLQLPDGRCAHRLGEGLIPDWDTRRRPLPPGL